MNRSAILLMSAVLGATTLLAVACSSSTPEPGTSSAPTQPTAPPVVDDNGDVPDTGSNNDGEDAGTPMKTDAGTPDAAPGDAGPKPFTKAEIQSIVNVRCAPCHVGNASAGMSLATDFTVATVEVASSEVPAMKRIAKGNKEASYLFHKLRGTHLTVGGSGLRMPRSGPPYLSDVEIERIGAFIDDL